eukprot:gene5026-5268_t
MVDASISPATGGRPATAAAAKRQEEDAVAVRVAVHIRPLVESEQAKGCQEILDVVLPAQVVCGHHTFTYDNVYGSGGAYDAANLYPDCVQPLVDGLFKGYNATVFAYGQTGSGKTYTMGSAWSPDMTITGVIPSVMDELFSRVDSTTNTDFTVKVSFVEIHKEEVRDLLWVNTAAPRPVVTIRELPSGVSLSGATECQVHSKEEMAHVLMQGTLMRAVASTNMNNRSSRSHAIFTITLEQRRRQVMRPASAPPAMGCTPGGTDTMGNNDSSDSESSESEEEPDDAGDDYLIAKMHLVDLAGSERAKRTGAEGARLKEAININKGLLALAKVITADSKLTRLLQDSLGGNSRTVMIACVSPADINREESLNTLRYADRARRIKNKPVVNRDPVAAQLAGLRQQIASLRAENQALKVALGKDAGAAAAYAAAAAGGQSMANEALQEAYDGLALRCNALEVENAKQQMELESARSEVRVLRSGLLSAETQRDQTLLRLEKLRMALAGSQHEDLKAVLQQDAAAAAGVAAGDGSVGGSGQQQQLLNEVADDVGIVASLRGRVSELEAELRQVRSLQRITSHALVRGMSTAGMSVRNSYTGHAGHTAGGAAGPQSHQLRHMSGLAVSVDGTALEEEEEEDEGAGSPVTPAKQPDDLLQDSYMEAETVADAEVLAQSAAHMVAREQMALKLAVLARQMEAKQKRLLALQSAAESEGAKSKYMLELQKERDTLAKEKAALLQKVHAVAAANAEERKRLEQQYKEKLAGVERRLKELSEKEKAAKRDHAQLSRVQAVCEQLQADISRMKMARAAVQRRMEAKEKEFREWRLMREREVLQLRRNAQRQTAALQQHQAMHNKQQAVLKRKTEEAEAARRKLRDLLEVQARNRKDKSRQGSAAQTGEASSQGGAAELELQPNALAPLLRTEKARREWVEQELELCNASWQYQKVLDGELAQRAEATRRLREVQKQLMLLGGFVPPSPVVTAAAAAHAAADRVSGGGDAAIRALLPREDVLQREAARLQDSIERRCASIKELQEQWERARAEEQSRGAGAADVKRWTGIRNIVEARELLRTLFVAASGQRAQVCESSMELAKLSETVDILQIKLDMALQQAAEAKRKAIEAEATTAAVITTPGLALAAAAEAGDDSDTDQVQLFTGRRSSGPGNPSGIAGLLEQLRNSSAGGRSSGAGTLKSTGQAAAAASDEGDVRDDVDIEADDLLHRMGLPPIQELPSPDPSTGGAAVEHEGAATPNPSSAGDAARSGAGGYQESLAGRRGSGNLGSTAQALAAKLDALEVDWQGYKRSSVAGAAGGGRHSLGGAKDKGKISHNSCPSTPREYSRSAGGFALRSEQPASAAGLKSTAGGANVPSSPAEGLIKAGRAGDHFWPPEPALGDKAVTAISSGKPIAVRSSVAGADGGGGGGGDMDHVAKELNFLDVQAEQRQAAAARQGRYHLGVAGQEDVAADEDFSYDDYYGGEDEDEDDEENDPSYDPVKHATPQGGRGGSRRSSRTSRSSRHASYSDDPNTAAGSRSASTRASLQMSALRSSVSAGSTGATPGAAATRNLVAQVCFNHEKRRAWERPVLDDINSRITSKGLPPVNKLTIPLLKDMMTGHIIDGKMWVPGNKTKDNLIADYRRMLQLNEREDEDTDSFIHRLTGSATWSMPASPTDSTDSSNSNELGRESPSSAQGPAGRGAAVTASSSAGRSMENTVTAAAAAALAGRREQPPVHLTNIRSFDSLPCSPRGHQLSSSPRRVAVPHFAASKGQLSPRARAAQVTQSLDGAAALFGASAERVLREGGSLQQGAQRSSSQKLNITIPATTARLDGPFSARVPGAAASTMSLAAEPSLTRVSMQQADRRGRDQPNWR